VAVFVISPDADEVIAGAVPAPVEVLVITPAAVDVTAATVPAPVAVNVWLVSGTLASAPSANGPKPSKPDIRFSLRRRYGQREAGNRNGIARPNGNAGQFQIAAASRRGDSALPDRRTIAVENSVRRSRAARCA